MAEILPFTKDINMRELLSDIKFFESYSRYDKKLGTYESWKDSVTRVMNMHRKFYHEKMTDELSGLIDAAEDAYKDRVVLGAQRALQFGGEQILKHQMRMYNCTSSYADRPEYFGEFFYILLCGAGAGFSVQQHHIAKMPKIAARVKQAKTHVIDDSIEGWSTALDVLMSSFFVGGGKHPEYEGRRVYFDSTKIRDKGSEISGGFKAPGPEPLVKALNLIERLLTFRTEQGTLRSIDIYDICMHAADAVLAGGVRRAATICLFSLGDLDMLYAKSGNWFEENPQRARSNNSVVVHRKHDITKKLFYEMMQVVRKFGEPGFVFVDSYEHCFNPCVEIGMLPQTEQGISGWQGCNLTEINGAKCRSKSDFFYACRVSAIIGTLQAGYTNFKFLPPVTKQIFEREALLGCSLTGWMNNPQVLLDKDTLTKGIEIIKETNELIAKLIGINPAARLACVKPAGNASVLLGTAPGAHEEHSETFLRTIQVNKMQDVCKAIKDMNPYMIEDSVWSSADTDYSIVFPVIPPPNSIFKKDTKAVDFLERVKFIQEHWVEAGTVKERCVDPTVRHNVSNTCYVMDDEWDAVTDYIFKNRQYFTGVSFFSNTGDKDYFQAPFTEVVSAKDIIKRYGTPALFASGLIVDSSKGFKNLWEAIRIATFNNDQSDQELRDIRAEWIRRFRNYAENYFNNDLRRAGYCLKDVYVQHKWTKIQQNHHPVVIENYLREERGKDIDTMGAIACAAGGCEI